MARYKYYTDGNGRTICVSTFAKKVVKGIAKCSPADTYDDDVGKNLARLRCDMKVAKKRLNKAKERWMQDSDFYILARKWVDESQKYLADASRIYSEACKNLNDYENSLK